MNRYYLIKQFGLEIFFYFNFIQMESAFIAALGVKIIPKKRTSTQHTFLEEFITGKKVHQECVHRMLWLDDGH